MKKSYYEVIINLHDGDGAGAASGADSGNSDSGTATGGAKGTEIRSEIKQKAQRLGLSDDLMSDYQKAVDSKNGTSDNGAKQQSTPAENSNSEEDFESLIKGKFKPDFDKRVSRIFNERFSKINQQMSDLQEQIAADKEIFEVLAQKYKGVDVNDRQALLEAVNSDNDIYSQAALDNGMTVDEVRKKFEQEREQKKTQNELEQLRREKAVRELDMKFQSLAQETKKIYPDFDLQSEMNNPEFQAALDFLAQRNAQKNKSEGKNDEIFNLTKAYEIVHSDELLSKTVSKAGTVARSAFAHNIAANGTRPIENANASGSSKPEPKSVRDMSDSEFDSLLARVKNGTAKIPR